MSEQPFERVAAMTMHAVWAGRYSASQRAADLRDCHIGYCAIQDCARPVVAWMVTEIAPGRPLVYGVCGADAALIHMHEQEAANA